MYNELFRDIIRQLWLFKHKGKEYTCPFCGYSSDMMLPFGEDNETCNKYSIIGAGKRNVRCLKCGSHDRERLIYIYLKFIAKIFDSQKKLDILHIAPEPRLSQILLKTNHQYICGDLFTEGYSYPEYVQNMDVLNLSFEDNTFDIILCNHVIEHIPADTKAILEIYRALKPGGFALLQVPISYQLDHTLEDFSIQDSHLREITFGQKDHCRLYGKDYVQRLQECGFRVDIVNISNDYSLYGINPDENLFVCHKMR